MNEPAVKTAEASISENEVLVVLAPDENTPAPAEALSLREPGQTGDETLVRNVKERADVEQMANEASAIAADTATALDVAHAAGLAGEDTAPRPANPHSQAKNEAQPEADWPAVGLSPLRPDPRHEPRPARSQ